MSIAGKTGAVALALGVALAAAPAFAQTGASGGAFPGGQGANAGAPGFGQGTYGENGHGGQGADAVVPQYWLADASLFIGNAARAADVLSMEEILSVPAPQILGNQAQVLIESTNIALARLAALQQIALATNPAALPAIRAAAGQVTAARMQAMQVARAAGSGVIGPAFGVPVRSALAHLLAAEQAMIEAGQAYGAPALATAGACSGEGAEAGNLGAGEAP
jgi:hypothetical protein